MSLYYRITDGQVLDLEPELIVGLAPSKQEILRPYFEDARPEPTATHNVRRGPVLITPIEARLTWVTEQKGPEQLAREAFLAAREIDLQQARTVYQAMKNGTGTQLQRTARLEKVMCRLLLDILGEEPA